MPKPSVAIVGRPNVGKSSLFNAMCGRRISIVDPTSGVTRDRVAEVLEHRGREFELVDTGGMGLTDGDVLGDDVEMQIDIALDQSDFVVFVVDAQAGIQPLDEEIAQRLRRSEKQAILVANKCDSEVQRQNAADFYRLGFDEVMETSVPQKRGLQALLDEVAESLPELPPDEKPEEEVKIAFVGRRNVGKSTLINTLANESRVIVSEVPGTTRDAVDVRFKLGGLQFVAVDTAGMRKRKQIRDSVDFYSFTRTRRSIKRADVVVHLVDAPRRVSQVDKKLAAEVQKSFKPCLLAVNKMDLAEGIPPAEFAEYVWDRLPQLHFAPIACIVAKTGEGVEDMIVTAVDLYDQSFVRVPTAELNEELSRLQRRNPVPSDKHGLGRILYATQVSIKPPTITLFTNRHALIDDSYQRYLGNALRETFDFNSIPIKFLIRGKNRAPRDTDVSAEP